MLQPRQHPFPTDELQHLEEPGTDRLARHGHPRRVNQHTGLDGALLGDRPQRRLERVTVERVERGKAGLERVEVIADSACRQMLLDSCGVEIGLKRLEARPTATLCIDCKTLDELRERQVAK